eukprot:Polyplicarium_translucidae@DN2446_c0_g1_i6.p1
MSTTSARGTRCGARWGITPSRGIIPLPIRLNIRMTPNGSLNPYDVVDVAFSSVNFLKAQTSFILEQWMEDELTTMRGEAEEADPEARYGFGELVNAMEGGVLREFIENRLQLTPINVTEVQRFLGAISPSNCIMRTYDDTFSDLDAAFEVTFRSAFPSTRGLKVVDELGCRQTWTSWHTPSSHGAPFGT